MKTLGAGKIEERLVDRQRLDQRRQRQHHLADLAADPRIFFHVGPDDPGVRTKAERLEHRHRRSHAVGTRDVARGGDNAAAPAADDDRLGGQRRIVALFDGGVERVAIDMGDGEIVEFVVTHEPRRAATAAPRRPASAIGETVAAEGAHGLCFLGPAERSTGACDLGRVDPGTGGKRDQETLVTEHMLQHAGEKAGLACRGTDLGGFYPGDAEKAVEPFGLLGDEPECLNRQHFGCLPRGLQGHFHAVPFSFP